MTVLEKLNDEELKQRYNEFAEMMSADWDYWQEYLKSFLQTEQYMLREVAFIDRDKTKFPFRTVVRSLDSLMKLIYNVGVVRGKGIAISVYDYKSFGYKSIGKRKKTIIHSSTPIIKHNWYDFDCDHKSGGELEDAYQDVLKLYDMKGKKPRIYFTGSRGFHVYVDFDFPITLEFRNKLVRNTTNIHKKKIPYTKDELIKYHGEDYEEKLDEINLFKEVTTGTKGMWYNSSCFLNVCTRFPTLDYSGLHFLEETLATDSDNKVRLVKPHYKQLARLPYTVHQGSGYYCIPVNPNWDLDRIIEESMFYHTPVPVKRKPLRIMATTREY